MRRLVAVVVLASIPLVSVHPVGAATRPCAPGEPHTCIVDNLADLDGAVLHGCGFPVQIGVVDSKEYVIHDSFLADGTEVQRVTGQLVLRFTNLDSGKSIVENVSGPSTSTLSPDGGGSFEGQGRSWLAFGPRGQGNTGEPGLVFTDGNVIVAFTGHVATSFSLSGTQVNGCALLS